MTRCWCGAEGPHDHLCGGGMGVHPGYLLALWDLLIKLNLKFAGRARRV